MSRHHVVFDLLHSSADVDVYRVLPADALDAQLAIVILDKKVNDATIVPCGTWSNATVIPSVVALYETADMGRMPKAPYGGKEMLYLLVECHQKIGTLPEI